MFYAMPKHCIKKNYFIDENNIVVLDTENTF